MLTALRRWRRERILACASLDEGLWHAVMQRYSFTRALAPDEAALLRERVILFLHEKTITGAGGLEVSEEMRLAIGVQAAMLVLGLDLDWYRGWSEVIVYPDEFVVDYEYMDADGVAHHVREPISGESWLAGPVILSWADAQQADRGGGYNVVMHEFAHKVDMLNGDANGFPPLHAGMNRQQWADDFRAAYEDFARRVDERAFVRIDPYAAENPAEFFAVLSEAFFEIPEAVRGDYPPIYGHLAAFYRQDPAARLERAA